MGDREFTERFVERLAAVGGVEAVTLGGSRAEGPVEAGTDWDFALYYRDHFDVDALRRAGWEGEVGEPGCWGGGVMNGGSWLVVDGRPVDLHYRDLSDVERRCTEAEEGHFQKELLLFYLAGVPTYLPVAELALNRVLAGKLPRPTYPDALALSAGARWHADACRSLDYAAWALDRRRDATVAVGNLARALLEEAHSRLAAGRQWVVNEKGMVGRARLEGPVAVLSAGGSLASAIEAARGELGC
ncbi:MAG TPA: hypothetical protein VKG43_00660 [Acidimicrobiales bacterium]|nr:hypothetical protein [Acidimicrobiales bacterium]